MHNLTIRYWALGGDSRAELPGKGIVDATLVMTVELYGPRTGKTRMGIIHKGV